MSSLCRVTTYDIVPFHLGIVIQEIEIVQKAFVTELLWRKNCEIVYSGKVIFWKDASGEGEWRNGMQNMVCSFCPVIT